MIGAALAWLAVGGFALAQLPFTKAQVGDRIRKGAKTAWMSFASGRRTGPSKEKSGGGSQGDRAHYAVALATESQKETAKDKKDELDDSLSDLNRSTNRLRRKFDPTDKWMETKSEVEHVLDDGRKINQVMVRGSYVTQAERY